MTYPYEIDPGTSGQPFALYVVPGAIERSNSSYGRWSVTLGPGVCAFFWRKAKAVAWMARYEALETPERRSMVEAQ